MREAIDSTTPGGRVIFHVFAALAEFEAIRIRERTHAGLAEPAADPPSLSPAKVKRAQQLYDAKELTVEEIATALGVSRATIYGPADVADHAGPCGAALQGVVTALRRPLANRLDLGHRRSDSQSAADPAGQNDQVPPPAR